ncbi:MAG: hypothetical protein H6965_11090 [Chromatiaceae bacterium]|nr:hypothetical protein [Chromatiaceae bacterium]
MSDSTSQRAVCQALDRLLLEQGCYTPLELLLAEGRLLYSDYETWRQGECRHLESRLFGDPVQIRALCEQGAAYARQLGLAAEPVRYTAWGSVEGDPLSFSPDPLFDRLFHTCYRKSKQIPQLDLFMDSTGVTLVNGIITALKERNLREAQRLLRRLFESEPGNSQIGDLEHLLGATERLALPLQDLPDVAAEIDYLEQELVPLAADKLGPGSRDFLAPFWQRVYGALREQPFDPTVPKLHASYPARHLGDWRLIQQSISSTEQWRDQPLLLEYYAQACERLQQWELALGCWFRICWRFPDQAAVIGRESAAIWRNYWHRFMDLEPELEQCDFPAWSILEQPGLLPSFSRTDAIPPGEAPEAYLITAELIKAAAAARPATEMIEQRQRLMRLNPPLFVHYLARFGAGR